MLPPSSRELYYILQNCCLAPLIAGPLNFIIWDFTLDHSFMRPLWGRWRFSTTYLRPSSRHHIATEYVVHPRWYANTFSHCYVFTPPYYRGRGGLVARLRLWDRKIPGSKPDSPEDPPCMGPVAR
ncbi:hypothetical protein AVEN_76021-1 [Araneus ventricosus]|uniref:Uncharacterized protein n=1 Tax=Araneus ventricosus TaxID=182803 RepID=A0A4Y2VBN5_ARAVE|nr:hypothetical protein AVEN_37616-1 [Araneus ventricosus]GBO22666.1 hypothetical protein AVEN_76021-1 [Araneus ventricosus]